VQVPRGPLARGIKYPAGTETSVDIDIARLGINSRCVNGTKYKVEVLLFGQPMPHPAPPPTPSVSRSSRASATSAGEIATRQIPKLSNTAVSPRRSNFFSALSSLLFFGKATYIPDILCFPPGLQQHLYRTPPSSDDCHHVAVTTWCSASRTDDRFRD